MNAAAALMAGSEIENEVGIGGAKSIVECARRAEEAIDNGRALEKLEALIKFTQSFK
jgi:anthranilate phosphoribosyltransferase